MFYCTKLIIKMQFKKKREQRMHFRVQLHLILFTVLISLTLKLPIVAINKILLNVKHDQFTYLRRAQ